MPRASPRRHDAMPSSHLLAPADPKLLVAHAALAALERLNFGVLLLGPEGELCHANRLAEDISRRTRAYFAGPSGRL